MDEYEATMTLFVAAIILQDFGDKRAREVWRRAEALSDSEQTRLIKALTPMISALVEAVKATEKVREKVKEEVKHDLDT